MFIREKRVLQVSGMYNDCCETRVSKAEQNVSGDSSAIASFARNRLEISNGHNQDRRLVSAIVTEAVAAEGCCIGLSIAMAIAKARNGEFLVESTVGAGSTFTQVFPNHQHSV